MVIVDGRGGLPAQRLVWVIGYGPPERYVGLYEVWAPHDCRKASWLRNMLMATLSMAVF